MDERVVQFRVGVVVVAAASITVILIMLFGALPSLRPKYTLHIRFDEAPGVSIDTPVRKSGVQIGRVSNVKLLDEGGVVLSMKVDRRFPLRRNEVCRIGSDSLVTGDSVLEWVSLQDRELSAEPLTDGEYLTNGEITTDPFQVLVTVEERMLTAFDSIQNAAGAIEVAGSEVAVLVRGLNTAVGNNEDQVRRILQKSEQSLDELQLTLTSINDVVGDDAIPAEIESLIAELRKTFAKTQQTLDVTESTLLNINDAAESATRNFQNLESLTQKIESDGPQLVDDARSTLLGVRDTLDGLDVLITDLRQFSKALNSEDSTIGQLVHDRELYDRLNRAIGNVEDVTRQLGPIASDVRIFTDKVARDPSRLLKGALDRRSPGMGLKRSIK